MPIYEFVCSTRGCGQKLHPFYPIHEGPPPTEWCPACRGVMNRNYGACHIQAMPVAWRDENRVSDDERKAHYAAMDARNKQTDALVRPTGKRLATVEQAHQEATRMFQSGEAVGISHEEARARGIQ